MNVIVTEGNIAKLTQNTLLWFCMHTTLCMIKLRVVTMLLLADKTACAMTGLCRCAWLSRLCMKRIEKKTPFGVNLMRSQVVYWAAQRLCLIRTHLGVWPTKYIVQAVRLQGVMVIQPV